MCYKSRSAVCKLPMLGDWVVELGFSKGGLCVRVALCAGGVHISRGQGRHSFSKKDLDEMGDRRRDRNRDQAADCRSVPIFLDCESCGRTVGCRW